MTTIGAVVAGRRVEDGETGMNVVIVEEEEEVTQEITTETDSVLGMTMAELAAVATVTATLVTLVVPRRREPHKLNLLASRMKN